MKQTILQFYINLAKEGTQTSIDEIMKHLNESMTLGSHCIKTLHACPCRV